MIVVMMAILYFVWIRPANKDRKKHQQMVESLKRGDEVVTSSGIIGTVADIADHIVTLEVARNVKIRLLKNTISKRAADLQQPSSGDAGDKNAKDAKKDEKAKSSKS